MEIEMDKMNKIKSGLIKIGSRVHLDGNPADCDHVIVEIGKDLYVVPEKFELFRSDIMLININDIDIVRG
jgi:prefoldin subunit 5